MSSLKKIKRREGYYQFEIEFNIRKRKMKKNKNLKFSKYGVAFGLIASMNTLTVLAGTSSNVSQIKNEITMEAEVVSGSEIPMTDGYIIVDELSKEEQITVEEEVAVNNPASQKEEAATSSEFTYYTVNDGGYHVRLSNDLQNWVHQMCNEYGIPGYEKLIISKLYCESSFNPNTKHKNKNGTTDYGIAQINSCNHNMLRNTLGITDFMDPYQSIRCGVYMMSQNLKKNGFNEGMALVAYNTGRNGIASTSYSQKVLRIKNSLIAE